MFYSSTRYEPSASGGGVSGPRAYGMFPQRRGPCQAERHPNGDPEGGAHAASEPEPVGAESGPDSEFGHFLLALHPPRVQSLTSVSLQLYQCMSDLECREGSYCHSPAKGPAHSRCQTCRQRKRRCHRDGMCCPGSRCSHSKTPLQKTVNNLFLLKVVRRILED